jgi:2-octaprenylphenol hydroxylase
MNTPDIAEFDIAIVGGGMAGSALACALAGSAYRVVIIEGVEQTAFSCDSFFDPRVVALSAASKNFLDQLGVWQDISVQRISPFEKMHVWDAEGTAQVNFDAAELRQPALGYIVENSLVVSALKQRLRQADNVVWMCPDAVIDLQDDEKKSSCDIILQSGSMIRSRLVVAADGALSALRQLAGIKTLEWDYGHSAVVATVKTEKPHGRIARQRFMSSGPLAFLPLQDKPGDEHWCSVVWSIAPDAAQALLDLPTDSFSSRLGKAFEFQLGNILEVHGRFAFPLRQRHATDYQRGRVVLIGDAAHTIHPLAGQGVNLGFMDVKVLAEELLAAWDKKLPPAHPSVLKRYQRRRLGANVSMAATMELFQRLFAHRELPVRWLRNTGMHGIDAMPALKKKIMRSAMGL